MKYLKLYEAFESNILSKTIGFIKDKDEKSNFLKILKNICDDLDFPFSKLSDDFFEYLPFKKALWKNDMTGDETCDATSEIAFPDYAVEGEVCKGGKIKRLWGSRTRDVECPICSGTGTKKKKPELKLIKFWFDKDGSYVTTSVVDGIILKSRGESYKAKSIFSDSISDYETIKYGLSLSEIKKLNDGDFVYFTNVEGSGIACVYKSRGYTYFLQNFANGNTPSESDWKKISPFSWVITSESDYEKADLVKPKDKLEKLEDEIDPYTWNAKVSIRRNRIQITEGSIYPDLKNCHFAIIFDLGKLKKYEYEKVSDISTKRSLDKTGATALLTDEQIKNQNIKRYIDEIVKTSDITSDLSNTNKVVNRFLGGNKILFLIMSVGSRLNDDIFGLITRYYKFIKSDESDKKYHIEDLQNFIKTIYRNTDIYTKSISKNIDYINNKLNTDEELTPEFKEKLYKIMNETERLSKKLYQKLSTFKVETIEDLEIISSKVMSIRNYNRTQLYGFYYLYYFWEYLSRSSEESAYYYLTEHYYITENIDKIINSLPLLERLLDKT
jgi:hypothetical protein